MVTLLENLAELVKMIFGVIVTPNYGASNENYNLLRFIYYWTPSNAQYTLNFILMLTFGLALLGVSIGILKRFLWKN